MALTEFSNAFFKTRLPMVPSTKPSSRPLRFLPSRTTTTSMSVKPSGRRCEGVGVAGRASPRVGVGCREDDVVGIGPVVVQAFPDAARAFRDVGLRGATVMHLEVVVGAVAKKLRAARPKVGEPGDVLLGRRGGCLVQMDRGHACPFLFPRVPGF